jgi:hypothetical protein
MQNHAQHHTLRSRRRQRQQEQEQTMPRQNRAQKKTVGRVMHEFKHRELKSAGRKVRNPKQAVAIGLSEAGASREQSPSEKKRALARTKRRERCGRSASGTRRKRGNGPTRHDLYQEAARRGIRGRSRMSKDELQRALGKK